VKDPYSHYTRHRQLQTVKAVVQIKYHPINQLS